MCSTADTVFSFPNVRCSHCRLSPHHSFSLPSSCTLAMSSCVPESTMRIAHTWSGVIFRLMPAVRMRWLIASVRSATPSGNSTSSRLRWVRVGSAFLGVVLRSMWSDAPVSAEPFALLIWMLMYPMFVSCFRGYTNLSVGVRLPAVRWLIGAFLALASAVREENALMSYGFLFPKSLRRRQR